MIGWILIGAGITYLLIGKAERWSAAKLGDIAAANERAIGIAATSADEGEAVLVRLGPYDQEDEIDFASYTNEELVSFVDTLGDIFTLPETAE